jgi:hypothetical protein
MSNVLKIKTTILLSLLLALLIFILHFLSIVRNEITDESYRFLFNIFNLLGCITIILLPATFFIRQNAIVGTVKGGVLIAIIIMIMDIVKGDLTDYKSYGIILILSIVVGTTIDTIKRLFFTNPDKK